MNEILRKKLNPMRFPNMSMKMAAIIDFLIGTDTVKPKIISMKSEGNIVYTMIENDCGYNQIDSMDDLSRNWYNLLDCSGLTEEERCAANFEFNRKICWAKH